MALVRAARSSAGKHKGEDGRRDRGGRGEVEGEEEGILKTEKG